MKLKLKEMNTDNILVFEGFKLKMKNFRFKNANEMNNFFNEALIESPFKFLRLNDEMIIERMHVSFSWMMVNKILAFALLVPAFLGVYYQAPQWFGMSFLGSSVLCFLKSKWLSRKLDGIASARIFFKGMSEDLTYLEEVRQELINKKK